MKEAGSALLALGLMMVLGSLFIETGVDTYIPSSSPYLTGGSQKVSNLARMQMQMMVFQAGLGAFLAGTVLYAGGSLVDAVQGNRRQAGEAASVPHVQPPAAAPELSAAERSSETVGPEAPDNTGLIIGAITAFLLFVGVIIILVAASGGGSDATSNSTTVVANYADDAMMDLNAIAVDAMNTAP